MIADEPPVTTEQRQAEILARAAAEQAERLQPLELPPPPFDKAAGYRALKKQWREDAAAKPGSLWVNGTVTDPVINPADWTAKPVPPRLWVASEWIPLKTVTALYGDGGTGKSLAALGLMTACALGIPWFGIPTAQCRSFGYFCEDDEDELHRRQDAINRALGCDYADLEPMRLQSRVGMDNVLMAFDSSGFGVLTPAFEDLCTEVMDHKARLAIIDTAADTFGGNENIRPQVRQFIGHCLGKLAKMMRGAVVLLAHPSRAGLASGEGDGGNTAWNASVRSRLYLAHLKAEDGTTDKRALSRKKANYARSGDSIELKWDDGYFKVEQAASGINATVRSHEADRAFLDALDKLTAQDINLSASPAARNYAPAMMLKQRMTGNLKRQEMVEAMQRLFHDGRIRSEQYGRPGREMAKIRRGHTSGVTVGHTSASD